MKCILKVDPLIKGEHGKLIEQPVVIRMNDFEEEAAKKFAEEVSKAHNTGQPVIPVVIDSFGGYVYSLLSIISDIENSEIPIATIAVGKSMSCGSFLLGFGTHGYRYMDPNASVMIHDVSACSFGKIEEMKSYTSHAEKLHKTLFRKLAKYCGHKDQNFFLKNIHERSHAEWFVSATEAKKLGLIDHIGVPTLRTKVTVSTEFG